ncbi:Avo2p [Saccharomyces eubayanus]|uniref:Avo2p n=1 Tax=Saccharomyces eubayanus TaxID=1080349 RepID=UPI0006C353B3|nr:AVO2-like protein [Saccharomyces eubayanus]KOG97409.1 AVO2-like protein [Saccharomyces eubayanus]
MLKEASARLREAIIEGNLLIVKRLLRRYPDLLTNIDSENGWSSLHYASYHGRYLICVYLIQLGHDKHELIKTFKGNTCVHLALMRGHEQTLHLLLQQFPQFINHRGENGRAPIHIACMKNYYQCLSLLIGVGADLWVMDTNGDTPLHVCLEYGSLNCMKMLVNEGEVSLDDNVKDKGNWKPLDVAQTFEVGNVYSKVLKDVKKKGVPLGTGKKPSSFRTPILGAKAAFEDGPSPVLSMNSPYSLYSNNSPLPALPRGISTHNASVTGGTNRRSSIQNPVFNPRKPSLSTDSFSSGSNSSPRARVNSKSTAGGSPMKEQVPELLRHSVTPTSPHNNIALINRYLLPNKSNENLRIDPQVQANNDKTSGGCGAAAAATTTGIGLRKDSDDENENQNDNENNSEVTRAEPRRRVSLLNIPISKLRNSSAGSIEER